jgi:plastocyanin
MNLTLRTAAVAAVMMALGSASASAETIKVTIKGLKFSPAEVTAHVGDTVEWTNEDQMAHTATARNKDWDIPIPAGKTASVVIAKAGDVDYFCRIHPSMTGKVVVPQ